MLHRFRLLLAVLLLAACSGQPISGDAGDSGTGADSSPDLGRPTLKVRFATFNTGRFFDTNCDSGVCDAGDFEALPSPAEFGFKADQITTAIQTLDADVVLLQELETQDCLDALTDRNPDYTVSVLGEMGTNASVDVALMARSATHVETRRHRADTALMLSTGQTKQFAREFLEVHLDRDGERIIAFVAHFKAKRSDDPAWRLAEAIAARDIVLQRMQEYPQALIVLGGDLNDTPGSPPLDALLEGGDIERVTEDANQDDIWTFRYFSDNIAIDHLLLGDTPGGNYVPGTSEVVRDQSGGLGGSDHAALAADFSIFLDD